MATLFTAVAHDPAAPDCFHAATKAVNFLAFTFIRLVSAFHKRETVPYLRVPRGNPFYPIKSVKRATIVSYIRLYGQCKVGALEVHINPPIRPMKSFGPATGRSPG